MKNMAIQFLEERQECLDDYDGLCGELVDAMMHWLGEDKVHILYIQPHGPDGALVNDMGCEWRYHMVPVIDGHVHDAWSPDNILPPEEYVKISFPGQSIIYDLTGDKLNYCEA